MFHHGHWWLPKNLSEAAALLTEASFDQSSCSWDLWPSDLEGHISSNSCGFLSPASVSFFTLWSTGSWRCAFTRRAFPSLPFPLAFPLWIPAATYPTYNCWAASAKPSRPSSGVSSICQSRHARWTLVRALWFFLGSCCNIATVFPHSGNCSGYSSSFPGSCRGPSSSSTLASAELAMIPWSWSLGGPLAFPRVGVHTILRRQSSAVLEVNLPMMFFQHHCKSRTSVPWQLCGSSTALAGSVQHFPKAVQTPCPQSTVESSSVTCRHHRRLLDTTLTTLSPAWRASGSVDCYPEQLFGH